MTLAELAADFRHLQAVTEEDERMGMNPTFCHGAALAYRYCATALEREIAPEVVREQLRASVEALSGKED